MCVHNAEDVRGQESSSKVLAGLGNKVMKTRSKGGGSGAGK